MPGRKESRTEKQRALAEIERRLRASVREDTARQGQEPALGSKPT